MRYLSVHFCALTVYWRALAVLSLTLQSVWGPCRCRAPARYAVVGKEIHMSDTDLALLAHLMRRAGFGATREELEAYATQSYAAVVEDLLHPERFPEVEEDVVCRYYSLGTLMEDSPAVWQGRWMYRMINTQRPLQEKMSLFWHGVFATGWHKSEHTPS